MYESRFVRHSLEYCKSKWESNRPSHPGHMLLHKNKLVLKMGKNAKPKLSTLVTMSKDIEIVDLKELRKLDKQGKWLPFKFKQEKNIIQITIIFLQFAHWTFTPLPSSLSNFLDPHSVHIGHALAGFIVEIHYQLFEQCLIQALVKHRHLLALQ